MRCRCHFYMSYIPQFAYCLLNVIFLHIYYKLHMKAAQLGLWGGVLKSVFSASLSLDASCNQNGPKTSSKSLRDPSGHQFLQIFPKFLIPFLRFLSFWGPFLARWQGLPAGQMDRSPVFFQVVSSTVHATQCSHSLLAIPTDHKNPAAPGADFQILLWVQVIFPASRLPDSPIAPQHKNDTSKYVKIMT